MNTIQGLAHATPESLARCVVYTLGETHSNKHLVYTCLFVVCVYTLGETHAYKHRIYTRSPCVKS